MLTKIPIYQCFLSESLPLQNKYSTTRLNSKNLEIKQQSPILSPKMRQFMENLNRQTGRQRRQTGLLDRYSGQLGGAAGLLGVIGTQ